MKIVQVVNSIYNSCSYVLTSDRRTWLVDCGDVDRLLPHIDGELCGVLLTHAHFDHIYGLNHMITLFPRLTVYTCQSGLEGLLSDKLNFSRYYGDPVVLNSPDSVKLVSDGDKVQLFDNVTIQALMTPGHSPDCVTWMTDEVIFTGDCFIPGVKMVTNLPHSDKAQAALSEALIRDLAMTRTVYPGHAPENIE